MVAHDDLTEVRVEVEDLRRQMIEAMTHLDGVRARMGLVGFRLGELARQSIVPTATLPDGATFCSEYQFREAAPDVARDDEAPVGLVEPVKSSAMIPPRELNRADRGGE